ncbi:ATP-binding protein [Thermodesulfobacteriota bacterium]
MAAGKLERMEAENKLLRDQIKGIENRFEEKIAELSMVREIGMTLLYISDFETACRFILDVIINNTTAQNCSLMLMDKEKDRLYLVGAADPANEHYVLDTKRVFSKHGVNYSFAPGEGAAGKALLERKPVLIHDTSQSPLFNLKSESEVKIGSMLSVPMMVENEPLGVLNLSHAETNIFETNDVNLFNIIANFVSIAIHSLLNYEKLQYSEAKYRALSENSSDGIAIIQDDLHIYSNPKYQAMTDYGFEELEKIKFEDLIDVSNDAPHSRYLRSFLKNGNAHAQYEIQLCGRDGKKLEVEINFSSIIYNGKRAFIIAARDLTDRKKLEQQLHHAQKMEAIGTLAGGVAHDLNNILAGLVSYPELILMDLDGNSPFRKPIQTIQKSGEKAAAVVQDLLTLARRGVTVNEVVNLNEVIAEYLESPEYDKLKSFHSGVKVDTILDDDLLNVLGSPVHLGKMIMNLIANASEAMPHGGSISISTENRYMDRPVRGYDHLEVGDYAVLSIADTGIGISSRDIERIFEPFYTKKVMGRSGTGLGMAVVWGTIKDHKGYIDIKSIEGKGTTFTLYFPITRKIVREAKTSLNMQDYMGKGESILVVDDMEEQREIATGMLRKLGYSVASVTSGEEAVEYLKQNEADLLLLDMIMDPGIDGLQTYKRILDTHDDQKAIIASGFAESERVKEAQSLGAGEYMKKPYMLEKIGLAVRHELDRMPSQDAQHSL